MQHNGGGFDVALDLVGGNMLSACCVLLALDGNLASITEAPGQDDFEALFQKNASFQPVGGQRLLADERPCDLAKIPGSTGSPIAAF